MVTINGVDLKANGNGFVIDGGVKIKNSPKSSEFGDESNFFCIENLGSITDGTHLGVNSQGMVIKVPSSSWRYKSIRTTVKEEELEELEQAVKEFEEAMKEDNLGVLAAADVKVHEVIYGSTHNKRLVQIISNIREQMYRYRVEYLKDVESRKTLVEEHYAVYRALKARNQQQAVKDICIHIVNQQNAILRSLEQMNKEEQEK